MKVKELITQLLNEDMDSEITIAVGEFKCGKVDSRSLIDGLITTTSGELLILPQSILEENKNS